MAQRPADELKTVSNELVSLLRDDTSPKEYMAALMHQLGLPLSTTNPTQPWLPNRSFDTNSATVGIWNRVSTTQGSYFERTIDRHLEWCYWADNNRIMPKKGRKRVVLLGESVARGYFFDPQYSIAMALESALNNPAGTDSLEVIDLAKVNMDLNALREISHNALALDPDALVVFAGNNWIFTLVESISEDDYDSFNEVIEQEGIVGLKNLLEQRLAQMVRHYLGELATLSAEFDLPILVVIPEFNLKDWRSSPAESILATSTSGSNAEGWNIARMQAEVALATENWAVLHPLAAQMVQLDNSHPLGYELLGDCLAQQGNMTEARAAYESARDTALYCRTHCKPRCLKVIYEVIRAEAVPMGLNLVDLPQIFRQQPGNELPDRDLFLDYCHLTLKGIVLMAAHTSHALLPMLNQPDVAIDTLLNRVVRPSNEVLAVAHLGCAIHNAHYGQPYSILYHHCLSALQASQTVAEAMRQLADFATRHSSTILCSSHERLVESGLMQQYDGGRGFLHPFKRKLMDVPLVEAIIDTLKTVGIDIRDSIEALRLREHSVSTTATNLLESIYHLTTYEFILLGEVPRGHYQARNAESMFMFVTDSTQPVNGKITFRSQGQLTAGQTIPLMVNGQAVAHLPISSTWTTCDFSIATDHLDKGMNTIALQWPVQPPPTPRRQRNTIDALLSRVYPALGEIYQFTLATNS